MTAPPVPLCHAYQPAPWGCSYHSAYALTGDESLLEHVRDANPQRFAAHLSERGILRRTLYNDLWATPVSSTFWHRLCKRIDSYLPLIVWYQSQSVLADHHAVAAVMSKDGQVWVSDSKRTDIESYSYEAFLETRYAKAQEVTQLVPAALELFPYEDALKVVEARVNG